MVSDHHLLDIQEIQSASFSGIILFCFYYPCFLFNFKTLNFPFRNCTTIKSCHFKTYQYWNSWSLRWSIQSSDIFNLYFFDTSKILKVLFVAYTTSFPEADTDVIRFTVVPADRYVQMLSSFFLLFLDNLIFSSLLLVLLLLLLTNRFFQIWCHP